MYWDLKIYLIHACITKARSAVYTQWCMYMYINVHGRGILFDEITLSFILQNQQ